MPYIIIVLLVLNFVSLIGMNIILFQGIKSLVAKIQSFEEILLAQNFPTNTSSLKSKETISNLIAEVSTNGIGMGQIAYGGIVVICLVIIGLAYHDILSSTGKGLTLGTFPDLNSGPDMSGFSSIEGIKIVNQEALNAFFIRGVGF